MTFISTDLWCNTLTFLSQKDRDAFALTCKGASNSIEGVDELLKDDFRHMAPNSLFGRIARQKPNWSAHKIIATANRLLQQSKYLIKPEELLAVTHSRDLLFELSAEEIGILQQQCFADFNKSVEKLSYTRKNRLDVVISEKRDQILFNFFENLCSLPGNPIPEPRWFLDKLKSQNLGVIESAKKIREWMEKNQPYLDCITTLGFSLEIANQNVQEARSQWILPPEVVNFSKLNTNELSQLFLFQAIIRNAETISKIKSNRFNGVSLEYRGLALLHAADEDYPEIIKALITSARFGDIPPEDLGAALKIAADKGYLEIIKALITSARFSDISSEDLGAALKIAANKGYLEIAEAFIASVRFKDISSKDLGGALGWAAQEGRLQVVKAFIASVRFKDISSKDLGWVLSTTASKGHLDVVEELIASVRFNEISSEALGLALLNAVNQGHPEVAQALIRSDRYSDISWVDRIEARYPWLHRWLLS